ncbi:hypothetical protein GYA49_06170 [Candidatus Beckwithbacteria bacterium]|nr:hypothetical protein [Candidatus Beckwithbacteria bacterium]
MVAICEVSTFHDPVGDTSTVFLQKHAETIKSLFPDIAIAVTDATNSNLLNLLDHLKIPYQKTLTGKGSLSRRRALETGLQSQAQTFFHIDLDRLLFWLDQYPQELEKVLQQCKNLNNQFLVIGRTVKAWQSHPIWQQEPEALTNQAISRELGVKLDVTAGCYAFDRTIAQIITQTAQGEASCVSDIEWVMIAKHIGAQILSIKVDGLSYETKLIFGQARASQPAGNYESSRQKLAEQTIAMIEKVKTYDQN